MVNNDTSLSLSDDLRLMVHVSNNWILRVSWNASKYEAQAPEGGWNYKVSVVHTIQISILRVSIYVQDGFVILCHCFSQSDCFV